jgi:hypothetical protein
MRSALLIALVSCVPAVAAAADTGAATHEALPFIDDDYERALREATQKKRPIFVDAWAPW